MRKIFSITLLIFSTLVSAQKLGLQGGYAFTNAFVDINLSNSRFSYSSTPASGFTVGPIFSWDFYDHFGADAAIMATLRGANLRLQYNDKTPIVFSRQNYYVEIPLHAYFRQKISNVELQIYLGPSFNIGLDGWDYAFLDNDVQRPLFDTKIDNEKIYGEYGSLKRFEFGVDAGVGAEWKNVQFKLRYQIGVNNISKNRGYPYGIQEIGTGIKEGYRQGVFAFTVGYVFDLMKKENKTYSK